MISITDKHCDLCQEFPYTRLTVETSGGRAVVAPVSLAAAPSIQNAGDFNLGLRDGDGYYCSLAAATSHCCRSRSTSECWIAQPPSFYAVRPSGPSHHVPRRSRRRSAKGTHVCDRRNMCRSGTLWTPDDAPRPAEKLTVGMLVSLPVFRAKRTSWSISEMRMLAPATMGRLMSIRPRATPCRVGLGRPRNVRSPGITTA